MKLPEELQFIANARMPQKTTMPEWMGAYALSPERLREWVMQLLKVGTRWGASGDGVQKQRRLCTFRQELENESDAIADIVLADFTRLADVREAAAIILDRYPRIDVLINNAGMHNTRRILTPNGIEMVFCVNHLASFLLTRLLLDEMLALQRVLSR